MPELLLRVAEFVGPKTQTMLDFALCSKEFFHLLAPMLATSLSLKDLVSGRIECSTEAEARAFSRIKHLSLDPPDWTPTLDNLMKFSRETITSLSVTAVTVWQLADHIEQAESLPNLRSLAIEFPKSLAVFTNGDNFIFPDQCNLEITELVMVEYYNSKILSFLVESSPRLEHIDLIAKPHDWISRVCNNEVWAWDGRDLTDETLAVIRRFECTGWSYLVKLGARPAFRPRQVQVQDYEWPDEVNIQEEAWRLLASMPDLETVDFDHVPTERLALGLIGTKSFHVSKLWLDLPPSQFEVVFNLLRNAPHETIHLEFSKGQMESLDVESFGPTFALDIELRTEGRRQRLVEVEFWRRVRAELGTKVSIEFCIEDEEAFEAELRA